MNNAQLDIFSYATAIEEKEHTAVSTKNVKTTKDIKKENLKVLERYKLQCRNKGLTSETIKSVCNQDLRLFLKFISDKAIVDVTHEDVEDFLIYCHDDRKNGDQALARKFTSLNGFYNTLIKQETLGITVNPLNKLDKPKTRKKERGYLTFEEYQQILAYVDSINDLRGAAIISLFFSSGCRLTEIWQLNRNSLDFKSRRFKVLGKGDKERICVFSEDAKERIRRYIDSRTDDLEALFISRQNSRWSKRAIQRYIKETANRAGITKEISPHLYRHTRAMDLLKKDAQLEVIQRLLGHSSIATTQIYAHMNIDTVQDKIDQLDMAE